MQHLVTAIGIIGVLLLGSAISAAIIALWVGFWVWVTPFTWMEVSIFMILVSCGQILAKQD